MWLDRDHSRPQLHSGQTPFLVDNSNDGPNAITRRNFQYHPQSVTVRLMDRMVEMSAFLNVTGLKTAKVYRVRPIQVHNVR